LLAGQGAHLLVVKDAVCTYPGRHGLTAVDSVSIEVGAGETVGLVGESGSGKSTLLKAIAGLHPRQTGSIRFSGAELPRRAVKRPASLRRRMQIVFQDPHSSLNPRQRVSEIIGRPLEMFHPELRRRDRAKRVAELLAEVRLDTELASRYPHQLSGGQKQRVGLARAFATDPDLILCDEVVSALDVSVQASILELLVGLSAKKGTALLFVTHDLAVVRAIADRIYVMNRGKIVEEGSAEQVFGRPKSQYTATLLAAIPKPAPGEARGVDTSEAPAAARLIETG
jgi:ABC-type glutathione transport system ATPase component